MNSELERKLSNYFILATVFACTFQILWFASTCFTLIDYDALSYMGIARYVRAGQFHESINAFRSPLISWLIAGGSFIDENLLRVGKVINIGCFVVSAVLVYLLAERLWQSRLVRSIAAFWFTVARGLASTAVTLVSPDFLLTVLVLLYFLLLLRCLRFHQSKNWILLGAVHGLAYLAKAFALPWLTVATSVAAAISGGALAQRLKRVGLALSLPILAAAFWATVLHSKYAVFTTGSQFKANFIHYNARNFIGKSGRFSILADTAAEAGPADPSFIKMDEAMVDDPMPPRSWAWQYRPSAIQMLRLSIRAEAKNLPGAVKEMTILLTPGGVLGFLLMLYRMARHRLQHVPEFRFIVVVAVAALALIVAYSVLVFLTTYAFPLAAVVMAVTARAFVSDSRFTLDALWRWVCIVFAVGGLLVSFVYRSSPFRIIDRPFEASCHDAAKKLRAGGGSRVVSVGLGPYPAQGVGWEAGFVTAYLADRRIIAEGGLPNSDELPVWMDDVRKASADAVLVWGKPGDARYQLALRSLQDEYPISALISDPALGEVGSVVSRRR